MPEPYQALTLLDPTTGSRLTVVPERGGMITQWQAAGQEILYLDQARFANPSLSVRGGIPILFPICGNLPGNTYSHQGQTFELKQHGFARDLPWQVQAATEDSLTLTLQSNQHTLAVYPFPFQLMFTYRLLDNTLEIQQSFINRGSEPMPFTAGLHPYFLTPDKTQLTFDIPAAAGWDQRTQEPIEFTGSFDFNQDEIDWAFRPLSAQQATLSDTSRNLKITLTWDSFYSLLVFWTVRGKDYCCLEPWSGPRNALNTQDCLTHLAPGETLETWVRFSAQSL